jgi:DNA gyrase subunit A
MGRRGIVEAYAGGRGRITLRGRVRQVKEGGRDALEIFEIPYQVVQSNLIEKIVDASREGRIPDVADVRNHSGRDAQTRILVVLKKGADPEVVEKQLYEFTPLQSTFSISSSATWTIARTWSAAAPPSCCGRPSSRPTGSRA